MKKASYVFIFILLSVTAFAQEKPSDFGEISMKELTTNQCSFDSSANAVFLFDVAHVDFIFDYTLERHVRIKILNKQVINTWANFELYFPRKTQRITKIKGATYNLQNGKIVTSKLESKNIFESKYNSYINRVKFALPNVVEGSVIEFSYEIHSGSTYDLTWQYQNTIPVYWSEYSFRSRGVYFQTAVQGNLPVKDHTETTKNGIKTDRWVIKNVPAFHEEPYSLPTSNLIAQLNLYLGDADLWASIGYRYRWLGKYGIVDKDSILLKSIVKRFDSLSLSKRKLDSILHFVKKKVKWSEYLDKIPDRGFQEAFESGKGSSSEVNMILMAILKKSGFQAQPVFLSTRMHGILQINRPSFGQLNDVIVAVNLPKNGNKAAERILVDATDPYLSQDYIPLRCLNGYGVLVGDKSELVPLISPKSRTVVSANLQLNTSDKNVNGELDISYYGLYASDEREKYFELGAEKYEQKIQQTIPSTVEMTSIKFINNSSQPLKENVKIKGSDLAQFTDEYIYFNPFITDRIKENIFKSETRILVIDFSPSFDQFYLAKIEIPENYSVEELPKSISFSLTDGSARFVYSITQNNNTLNFASQLMINRAVFQPDEYPTLREFYAQVISKQAEQIVIKRKK